MNMSYGLIFAERMNEYGELRLNSCGKNEWILNMSYASTAAKTMNVLYVASYVSTVAERINEYGGVTAQLLRKE